MLTAVRFDSKTIRLWNSKPSQAWMHSPQCLWRRWVPCAVMPWRRKMATSEEAACRSNENLVRNRTSFWIRIVQQQCDAFAKHVAIFFSLTSLSVIVQTFPFSHALLTVAIVLRLHLLHFYFTSSFPAFLIQKWLIGITLLECGGLHEAGLALRKHEKCIITRVMQGRLLTPLVLWVTRDSSSEKEIAIAKYRHGKVSQRLTSMCPSTNSMKPKTVVRDRVFPIVNPELVLSHASPLATKWKRTSAFWTRVDNWRFW